jgi:hypothetical protein
MKRVLHLPSPWHITSIAPYGGISIAPYGSTSIAPWGSTSPASWGRGLSRKQPAPFVIDRGEAPQATAQGAALRPTGTARLQQALKGRKPVAYGASPLIVRFRYSITQGCTLRYCLRRFAAINNEGGLLKQPPSPTPREVPLMPHERRLSCSMRRTSHAP